VKTAGWPLVKGPRNATYFEHFWNDFAAESQSFRAGKRNRVFYAKQYAQAGAHEGGL